MIRFRRIDSWLIAGAISLLVALPAHAQFDISWHDCSTQPGAAQNLDYACDGSRDGNPFRLVFSFISPDLPYFVGLQAVIDVRSSESAVPDWWRMGTGECRDGATAFPASLSGIGTGTTGACPSPWGDVYEGGYQWVFEGEGLFTSSGRLKLAVVHGPAGNASPIALEAGQRYLGGVITLDPGPPNPGGANPCPGCGLPACIVLNQIELYQVVGSPGGDINILKSPIDHGFVTWQGGDIGGQGCPLALPTRRATWGAIKAIYR